MRRRRFSSLRTRVSGLAVGIAALVITLAAIPLAALLAQNAYAAADGRATFAAQVVGEYFAAGGTDPALLVSYLQRINAQELPDGPQVTVFLADGRRLGAALAPGVALTLTRVTDPRLAAERPPATPTPTPTPTPTRKTDDDDHHTPAPTPAPDEDGPALAGTSIPVATALPSGRAVQVFAGPGDATARIVAVMPDAPIRAGLVKQYALAGLAGVALLLLAWGAADLTGRRLTRPLQRTARTAIALQAGDLAARAPTGGPSEVAAVAVELNALADRIDELLTREREAAADLSHRLRTPLMSVRLAVESLPESAGRAEVEASLNRLERMLTGVIRAARRGVREGVHPRCDATAVVADRVAFWRALAEDQERAVSVDVPEAPLWVRSTIDDLGAGLDALIENVIAHTAVGTALRVGLRATDDGVELVVSDDGPGIPASALARGISDRGSTGLGLDIARSVAEAGGGSLDLVDTDAAGLSHAVRLRLVRAD